MTATPAQQGLPNPGKGDEPDFGEVDRALAARPSVTIRLRIAVSMGLCFLLTAAVTVAWMFSVREVARSQAVLERANRYAFELEQARRYEKNFLLYGASMDEALVHVDTAHRLLVDARNDGSRARDRLDTDAVEKNLVAYGWYLEQLGSARRSPGDGKAANAGELERELRRTGARGRERQHADLSAAPGHAHHGPHQREHRLGWPDHRPARHCLSRQQPRTADSAPLGRFVAYTQRIAAGDFSPIAPARRFKDEFSDLALAVNRMLARLKAHEAQLTRSSRMAAVGTLTAGIAHELNNPLNNIGLTVEALLDGFDDYDKADKVKMLEDVSTQLDRASATVRNLLDFTRVDSPVFAPLSLAEVAAESARLVGNEARISGVHIDVQLSPDLCPARGNPRDLQQVFLNLFLNAIQAMPKGGTLSVDGAVCEDRTLRIDVADTGIGIPEEHLASIFDPFFTTKEVGTGLGLSVSYGIVQKHGGRLEVHSKVGVGTTFTLWIPCADSPSKGDGQAAEPPGRQGWGIAATLLRKPLHVSIEHAGSWQAHGLVLVGDLDLDLDLDLGVGVGVRLDGNDDVDVDRDDASLTKAHVVRHACQRKPRGSERQRGSV